ncbi:MAG: acetate/propionate family kinase [Nocardioidaceae bacterium]|nr:acetate/propionate family kinase [Nocardioidaceae bacterium]MCL2613425.1 acetate/propionate family kinase [Nocardioidaceae bacterium]
MAATRVLVLNVGSTTVKFQVVDPASGGADVTDVVEDVGDGYDAAFGEVARRLTDAGLSAGDLLAVGHRVVHGGSVYSAPVVLDDDAIATIEGLSDLAPLHNPPAVAGIRAARSAYPSLPHVAVFDTAFFADLPPAAATYAVPREVAHELGLRRYGAHGTSHAYVSRTAAATAQRLGNDAARQIVLHLGGGASASAIRDGRPVETSMGLTPMEGLVMGTRSGDVDPGLVLRLLRSGRSVDEVDHLLNHDSGVLGLSGTRDFRDLEERLHAGDHDARRAFAVYVHRLRKYVGAYVAVLGGLDVLTFTAGVGEHRADLRSAVLADLAWAGIEVDPVLNASVGDGTGPWRISPDDADCLVLVVATNEEWEIARQTADLVG